MLSANLVSVFMQMQNRANPDLRASTPPAMQAFPQLSSGQVVTASIVARVSAGLFLADIESHRLQINLPDCVAPGDSVALRVLRPPPQPAFEILPRALGETAPTTPTLSQGAQIIQMVLAAAEERPATAAALPLAEAPVPAEQLALGLRRAISESGVFYEAHLAAWAGGQRALCKLRREPQARWSSRETLADVEPGHAAAPSDPLASRVPEEALPVLRQQIETIESRQVHWNSQIWPGQSALICIAEDSAQARSPSEASAWQTSITADLPRLGAVRADLSLSGTALRISMRCPDPGVAQELRRELPDLDTRLRIAGLHPDAIEVASHA